jgi:hypothetical protein
MRFFDGENWRQLSDDELAYRRQEGQLPVVEGDCSDDCLLFDEDVAHVHSGKSLAVAAKPAEAEAVASAVAKLDESAKELVDSSTKPKRTK